MVKWRNLSMLYSWLVFHNKWRSRADSAGNWKEEQIIAFVSGSVRGGKLLNSLVKLWFFLVNKTWLKPSPTARTIFLCSQILNRYRIVKSENFKCILLSCSSDIYLKKGFEWRVLLACSPYFEREFGNICLPSVEILIWSRVLGSLSLQVLRSPSVLQKHKDANKRCWSKTAFYFLTSSPARKA